MKNYLNKITINPDICDGKPTIRGMRITVKTIMEYLAAGESIENILKAYPVLEKEDISAALQYASAILAKTSPKIVYFQLGNMTLKELSNYFYSNWEAIQSQLLKGSLIIARKYFVDIIL